MQRLLSFICIFNCHGKSTPWWSREGNKRAQFQKETERKGLTILTNLSKMKVKPLIPWAAAIFAIYSSLTGDVSEATNPPFAAAHLCHFQLVLRSLNSTEFFQVLPDSLKRRWLQTHKLSSITHYKNHSSSLPISCSWPQYLSTQATWELHFSFSRIRFYKLWLFVTNFNTHAVSQTHLELQLSEK